MGGEQQYDCLQGRFTQIKDCFGRCVAWGGISPSGRVMFFTFMLFPQCRTMRQTLVRPGVRPTRLWH